MHHGQSPRFARRGIPTEKGEKNRWIKATNALIRNIAGKIKAILKWITDIKADLNEKSKRGIPDYVNAYKSMRMAGAYSQKAKVQNVKDFAGMISFIKAHNLHTIEDMKVCSKRIDTAMDELKQTMNACTTRKKELNELLNMADNFTQNEQIILKLETIHFKGAREKYMKEHESEIKLFNMAKRKLSAHCDVTKPLPLAAWATEIEEVECKSKDAYSQFRPLREESDMLWKIKYQVQKVLDAETSNSFFSKENVSSQHSTLIK